MADSVLYMLCEGEECPLTEHLDAPSLYMFQCYIDYNMPNSSFVWRVDGIETTEGVESIQFHLKTNETELLVPSSVLTVSLQRYVAVRCSLGNLSRVVHIAGNIMKNYYVTLVLTSLSPKDLKLMINPTLHLDISPRENVSSSTAWAIGLNAVRSIPPFLHGINDPSAEVYVKLDYIKPFLLLLLDGLNINKPR